MSLGERRVRLRTPEGEVISGGYLDSGDVWLHDETLGADGVTFLPSAQPTKIVGVGLNYSDHPAELGMELPPEPVIFLKPPSSLSAHGAAIVRPAGVERLDYEGELGVVIGRRASRVAEEDALAYVEGLTVGNDVTAREFQVPGSQWTRAKGYDTFAPIGPCLLNSTEWAGRSIETRLNGRVVQSASTSDLVVGVPQLISFISSFMTLEPGDVILTGTPSGVGPMADGDVVEVEIEGIGVLRNKVVAPLESVGGEAGSVEAALASQQPDSMTAVPG